MEIALKNYRRFPDSAAARFEVREGTIAFVGANNAGKSSLLRFFYEFRHLFQSLASIGGLQQCAAGDGGAFNNLGLLDMSEVFTKNNDRDLVIEFSLPGQSSSAIERMLITIPRNSNRAIATMVRAGQTLEGDPKVMGDRSLLFGNRPAFDVTTWLDAFRHLSK